MRKEDIGILNRAKLIDEPLVRELLSNLYKKTNRSIDFILPTKMDDYNHRDIQMIESGKATKYFDVKRNNMKNANSPNFLFTFVNHQGVTYPLSDIPDTAYIVFIDDVDGNILFIDHTKMREFVNSIPHRQSQFSEHSKYILIPKYLMRNAAKVIFKGNPYRVAYLAKNRNESDFISVL